MTFAEEASDGRRNKLRVDGFTGSAIVMKVEYFIAATETFAVSRQTFISGKTHLPKIGEEKNAFSPSKHFFCCALLSNFLQTKRRKKQFYNLGRYMCALAV